MVHEPIDKRLSKGRILHYAAPFSQALVRRNHGRPALVAGSYELVEDGSRTGFWDQVTEFVENQ